MERDVLSGLSLLVGVIVGLAILLAVMMRTSNKNDRSRRFVGQDDPERSFGPALETVSVGPAAPAPSSGDTVVQEAPSSGDTVVQEAPSSGDTVVQEPASVARTARGEGLSPVSVSEPGTTAIVTRFDTAAAVARFRETKAGAADDTRSNQRDAYRGRHLSHVLRDNAVSRYAYDSDPAAAAVASQAYAHDEENVDALITEVREHAEQTESYRAEERLQDASHRSDQYDRAPVGDLYSIALSDHLSAGDISPSSLDQRSEVDAPRPARHLRRPARHLRSDTVANDRPPRHVRGQN